MRPTVGPAGAPAESAPRAATAPGLPRRYQRAREREGAVPHRGYLGQDGPAGTRPIADLVRSTALQKIRPTPLSSEEWLVAHRMVVPSSSRATDRAIQLKDRELSFARAP